MSNILKLVFNKNGNFLLKSALCALNNEYQMDRFFSMSQNHTISRIVIIELSYYKCMQELVNYLIRIKQALPNTSVLLITTDEQIIPMLKCGAISISAPISKWKNMMSRLKNQCGNIDSVIFECISYIENHNLSAKQRRVINCLGVGMNPNEIAKHLFLSVKTVYTYISRASTKYGFSTNKKFHRYIINETRCKVAHTSKLMLR